MTSIEKVGGVCLDCDELASVEGRCRDCDIEYSLNSRECSVCQRIRWQTEHPESAAFARSIWGEPCECPQGTPSVHEERSKRA